MYHIVKDVASLITTLLENHSLTALSQLVSHFQTRRFNTYKLGQLTSLRDIENIAKIHRQYSWDVRGRCTDTNEGIFLSVVPFKEEKQINIGPFI